MDAKLRKAAILVASLDPQSADALLQLIGPEQAQRIRMAVVDLTDVDADERGRVIEEFLVQNGRREPLDHSGIELDGALASQFQRPAIVHHSEPAASQPDRPPFRFLHEAAGDTLARFLHREHPQTIAVVLSHLPPARASEVVVRLDPPLQVEVLRRIAELDQMDPEILREVERGLHSLLADELNLVQRRSAGLAAVDAILRATDRSQRTQVMSHIKRHANPLAQQLGTAAISKPQAARPSHAHAALAQPTDRGLPATPNPTRAPASRDTASYPASVPFPRPSNATSRPDSMLPYAAANAAPAPLTPVARRPIPFANLVHLGDATLAKLFQQADAETLLLALTGAPRELVDRLVKHLSAREAREFRRRLENVGALRLRDVERAQEQLGLLAAQLIDEEQFGTSPRGFAVAA